VPAAVDHCQMNGIIEAARIAERTFKQDLLKGREAVRFVVVDKPALLLQPPAEGPHGQEEGIVLGIHSCNQSRNHPAAGNQAFRTVIAKGENRIFFPILPVRNVGDRFYLVVEIVHHRRVLHSPQKGGGHLRVADQGRHPTGRIEADLDRPLGFQIGEQFPPVVSRMPGALLQGLDPQAIIGRNSTTGKDITGEVAFLDTLRVPLVFRPFDKFEIHRMQGPAIGTGNMIIEDHLRFFRHIGPDRPVLCRRSRDKPALAAVLVGAEPFEEEL